MKTKLFTIVTICVAFSANAQKPFKEIGKDNEVEVLTLSNGRYIEHFTYDTLRQIGSVMFNTITHKVEYFIPQDDVKFQQALDRPKEASRFMSIDPLASKFPFYTPYQFAGNKPIVAIDLDGLEDIWVHRLQWNDGTETSFRILRGEAAYESTKLQLIAALGYTPIDDGVIMTTAQFGDDGQTASMAVNYRMTNTPVVEEYRYGFFERAGRAMEGAKASAMGNTPFSSWEGSDNAVVPWEQGKKIMFGTVGTILSGGTLLFAEGATASAFAISGIVTSADDMTADNTAQTMLSKTTGISQEKVDNAKLVIGFASFSTGTQGLIKDFVKNPGKFDDKAFVEFMGVINDEIQTITGAAEATKPEKK